MSASCAGDDHAPEMTQRSYPKRRPEIALKSATKRANPFRERGVADDDEDDDEDDERPGRLSPSRDRIPGDGGAIDPTSRFPGSMSGCWCPASSPKQSLGAKGSGREVTDEFDADLVRHFRSPRLGAGRAWPRSRSPPQSHLCA